MTDHLTDQEREWVRMAERVTPDLQAVTGTTPSDGPARLVTIAGREIASLPVRLTPGGCFLHNHDARGLAVAPWAVQTLAAQLEEARGLLVRWAAPVTDDRAAERRIYDDTMTHLRAAGLLREEADA